MLSDQVRIRTEGEGDASCGIFKSSYEMLWRRQFIFSAQIPDRTNGYEGNRELLITDSNCAADETLNWPSMFACPARERAYKMRNTERREEE